MAASAGKVSGAAPAEKPSQTESKQDKPAQTAATSGSGNQADAHAFAGKVGEQGRGQAAPAGQGGQNDVLGSQAAPASVGGTIPAASPAGQAGQPRSQQNAAPGSSGSGSLPGAQTMRTTGAAPGNKPSVYGPDITAQDVAAVNRARDAGEGSESQADADMKEHVREEVYSVGEIFGPTLKLKEQQGNIINQRVINDDSIGAEQLRAYVNSTVYGQ